MADGPDAGYLLTNASDFAAQRFAAFIALFDPSTFRHLDALGLEEGWRCWEVGAGGTSVIDWLANRVGERGHVLATDIDVTQMAAIEMKRPNVTIQVHDVAADPVSADSADGGDFDLVHARLVLVHVPERERALANLVAATKPGGWVCLEDADPALQPLSCLEETGPEQVLANKLRTGFRALMAGRGVDLAYGRTLPRLLRAAGLVDVQADASFPLAHPACAPLESATINLIRPQLIDNGIATEAEVDQHLANVAAGLLDLTQPPMITAWGRRPA